MLEIADLSREKAIAVTRIRTSGNPASFGKQIFTSMSIFSLWYQLISGDLQVITKPIHYSITLCSRMRKSIRICDAKQFPGQSFVGNSTNLIVGINNVKIEFSCFCRIQIAVLDSPLKWKQYNYHS